MVQGEPKKHSSKTFDNKCDNGLSCADNVIQEYHYVQIRESRIRHKDYGRHNGKEKTFSWNNVSSKNWIRTLLFRGYYSKLSSNKRKTGTTSNFKLFLITISIILMSPHPSTADYYSDYVSLILSSDSKSACDGEYLRIDCPEGTSIHVLGAMYGRKVPSTQMCPPRGKVVRADEYTASGEDDVIPREEDLNCEAKAASECEDQRICRLLVHRRVFGDDPCPRTNKYLTVNYQCAPVDFRQLSSCVRNSVKLRCRQGTVISIYDVIMTEDSRCKPSNHSSCSMTSESMLDDVINTCHAKEKCTHNLEGEFCWNYVKVIHTCVPKELLTSELPSSVRLLTTTVTSPTTAEDTTVPTTVTTSLNHKGDTTSAEPTSVVVNTTSQDDGFLRNSTIILYDVTNAITIDNNTEITTTETNLSSVTTGSYDIINSNKRNNRNENSRNDFAIPNRITMETTTSLNTSFNCVNCSAGSTEAGDVFFNHFLASLKFFREHTEQILIAVLSALCVALILVVFILACPCKVTRPKKSRESRDVREDSRDSIEEEYRLPPVEQEDEHENMSLLGSLLQRPRSHTASSSTTAQNQRSPNSTQLARNPRRERRKKLRKGCGPDSIFGKICCNCCCSNAPWQRTHILKRHRGDVYHVKHHGSSSLDDEPDGGEITEDSLRASNRVEGNQSPIVSLQDHLSGTEYPLVTSHTNNFRPISRSTQRHYSTTPEPDQPYRTNHTFHPRNRLPSQRSDNAISINSTHHDVIQTPISPLAMQTPRTAQNSVHPPKSSLSPNSGPIHTPAHMGTTISRAPVPNTPTSPRNAIRGNPKVPAEPFVQYSGPLYPAYSQAYEQYDNAGDYATTPSYTPHPYAPYNTVNHFPTFYPPNGNGQDHYVQRRNRQVDLAANARTVDLSRNNSLSRNSWIEIRRSSIYDNSLPRNSDVMYDYYQQLQELQQNQQQIQQTQLYQHHQHAQQHELPGSRSLNQYYP